MDEADDDYHGPPLPGGQRQLQGNSQMRQQMSYSSFSSPGPAQRQPQTIQMALEMEREMYLRRQLEIKRDLQLRHALMQEHRQHLMSELENQHQLQHLQQNPLLQQQSLMELQQQLGSPGRRTFSLQEEQLLQQQQATQQRLLRQQQQQMQMQEQRRLQRDLQIPEPSAQKASRPGSAAQQRARRVVEEDSSKKEDAVKPPESVKKSAVPTAPKDKKPKDEAPNETSKDPKEDKPEKREDSGPIQAEEKTETVFKDDTRHNEEKRKRTGSEGSLQTSQPDKRLKGESKSDDTEETPKSPPRKKESDIALLLRATEDPAVKNRSLSALKRSTSEPDLEYQHSSARNDQKSFIKDTNKEGSTDHNKTSDLEALALEALRQNAKPPPSQDKPQPNGQIAALIATLQRATPPSSPAPQPDEEEDNECDAPDSPQEFVFSLPQLPVEPSYVEPGSTKDKGRPESAKTDRTSRSGKDAGSAAVYELTSGNTKTSSKIPGIAERDVKEPVLLPDPDESSNRPAVYTIPIDTWWPSNSVVKRERRLKGYRSDKEDSNKEDNGSVVISEPALKALKDRLENQVEPGVLQKLPHCKLHRLRSKQRRDQCPVPLFCFQVTESHCTDMMVCCSICSTWRHIACGGHYTKCPVQSNAGTPFTPICDRCFEEAKFLQDYPRAQRRIERQRTEHLRRSLSTTAVIRQASLAKHGGTYKWPLGSVTNTHIGGHTRSVHSRHERSEKQWSETAAKLGNGLGYRPKERAKVRTREFERILVHVEDAEGHTDRHNMMLFLQSDTEKEHPAGFEMPRRNFFDPEEDPDPEQEYSNEEALSEREDGSTNGSGNDDGVSEHEKVSCSLDISDSESDAMSIDSKWSLTQGFVPDIKRSKISSQPVRKREGNDKRNAKNDASSESRLMPESALQKEVTENDASSVVTVESQADADDEGADEAKSPNDDRNDSLHSRPICARAGCRKKPRFDSLFCSDSCGVSAIERDLLHSFEYASEIHPSLLRP